MRFVLLLLIVLSGCDKNSKPAPGKEKGPCYGNGTCDEGLTCLSDLCVSSKPSAPLKAGGADRGNTPTLELLQSVKVAICSCEDAACAKAALKPLGDKGLTSAKGVGETEAESADIIAEISACSDAVTDVLTVKSLSPANGPPTGGASVTIEGTGFRQPTVSGVSVYFGDKKAQFMRFGGNTKMVVVPPPATEGSIVDVQVTFKDGRSHSIENAYTYGAPSMPAPDKPTKTACESYVVRVCACAKSQPSLATECEQAKPLQSSLKMNLDMGSTPGLSSAERGVIANEALRIESVCRKANSQLDTQVCPRLGS